MIRLKNWLITTNQNGFIPPELVENYLHGNVYGHPKFNDGDPINTSPIRGISDCGEYKIVKTKNTEYTVYPEDVSPEYEEKFPDAFNRLSVNIVSVNIVEEE